MDGMDYPFVFQVSSNYSEYDNKTIPLNKLQENVDSLLLSYYNMNIFSVRIKTRNAEGYKLKTSNATTKTRLNFLTEHLAKLPNSFL